MSVRRANQAPDDEYIPAMLSRTIANLTTAPETLTADAGYLSQDNVRACLHADVQPYFAEWTLVRLSYNIRKLHGRTAMP